MTPEFLERTIRFFADRNYDFLSLDQLFESLRGRKRGRKFVVFTFDDGYVDNLLYAYPIFKKHGIPFAIYVTTNFPDRNALLWWYLLEDLILNNSRLEVEFDNQTHTFACATRTEKVDTFLRMRPALINTHEEHYLTKIRSIFEPYNVDIYKKTEEMALSWEQIKKLSEDPLVTIAAHTVNHYALNTLSEAAVRQEIMESKTKIEKHTGQEVVHFAYPFGSSDEVGERECEIVKRLGFRTATTSRLANVFPAHRHHLECLPRIIMFDEPKFVFLNLWVSGALPFILYRGKRVITTEKITNAPRIPLG